ncbi:hypothetical protein cypCar_00000784 [Cyprinus carpio]|nr:hypothetical protein cypCar_00000784 [Cyprinus carpio]
MESEVSSLQERLNKLRRELRDSEERASLLKVEGERLATALAHTELQESQLREQLQAMAASLTESNAAAGTAQDQAAQLQQVLTASEHDWKMLQAVRQRQQADQEVQLCTLAGRKGSASGAGCCYVLSLQSQISILEQTHSQRLLEVMARHRQELDLETEWMKDSQQQAERALEAQEKAHCERVHCLEEQVCTLKKQLKQEMKRRQAYMKQMLRLGL